MSRGVALGPDTDVTHAELCLGGDETCDVASTCTGCDKVICPEHSDEFTTCAGSADLLHCLDCEKDCIECVGAGAEDHADDMHELHWRRGDF